MLFRKSGSQQLFCKGTFATGESNLFFGICSSVPSGPTSLDPANSPEKFLQKLQKRAAKFNLSPCNSELLAPISTRAN